jgi:uncharacterized membrane protein required for colicin V production
MCHRVSAAHAWQCACGYEFGQYAERVRVLLRDQQTNAWIMLASLVVVDVAAVCGMVYAAIHGFIVFSGLGFTALTLLTARTVRTLLITRASLRELDRRDTAVPRAIVLRR